MNKFIELTEIYLFFMLATIVFSFVQLFIEGKSISEHLEDFREECKKLIINTFGRKK